MSLMSCYDGDRGFLRHEDWRNMKKEGRVSSFLIDVKYIRSKCWFRME